MLQSKREFTVAALCIPFARLRLITNHYLITTRYHPGYKVPFELDEVAKLKI